MAQHHEEYLTKTINFGTGSMTLYSLDGQTWSSRREELTIIKERQDQQRMVLMGKKDEKEEVGQGIKFGAAAAEEEEENTDTVDREKVVEAKDDEPFVIDEDVDLAEDDDEDEDEAVSAPKKNSKPVKKPAVKSAKSIVIKKAPKAKKAAPVKLAKKAKKKK